MENEYKNKIAWCHLCNQGWIEILKDISTGELYCCCDECLSVWNNPEEVRQKMSPVRLDICSKAEFLANGPMACNPTDSEIDLTGWRMYIIK